MRVWIDGQCLQTLSRRRGIGRYVHELIGALAGHGPEVELSISFNAAMPDEAIAARDAVSGWIAPENIHVWQGIAEGGEVFTGSTPRRLVSELALAHHVAVLAPDVALCASLFEGAGDCAVPLLARHGLTMPMAAIFYDLIPHTYRQHYLAYAPEAAAYDRRLAAHAGFDALLGISQFATRQAARLFPGVACTAIDAGPPSSFQPSSVDEADVKPPGVTAPFLLYVGALDWRKNVATVIDAFKVMPRAVSSELQFVIAGTYYDEQAKAIERRWRSLGLPPGNLVMLGRVSDAMLGRLYRSAHLVIQPSLMEGFGLTALEAMICGAPVIAANAGALPEVVADDRALFDPTDAGQIAVLVARVCADEALRASLVERGRAQVAKFTWARTARLAVSTLREAINRRGTPLPAAANSLDLARSNVAARARQFDIDAKVKATLFAVAEPRDETTDRAPRRVVDVSGTPTVRFIRGDTVLLLDGVWDRTRGVILRKARLQGCDVVTALHDLGPLRMSGTCAPGVAATCSAGFEMALQFSTGFVCSTREVADGLIALLTAIRFPRRLRVACLDLGRADEPEWAARMSEIITGNGCYKTHVPVEEAPYGALSDLGQTVMRSALSDGDRHYDLELVEGPILTAVEQAGDTMRFVVALTNRSTTNWSSRGPDDAGLGIFLGCRVVNRRGRAAGGEIARASIPFVLPAGDRHVMAIDVASKALRRRVTALDIEVLQDRVGWFGGALRVRV